MWSRPRSQGCWGEHRQLKNDPFSTKGHVLTCFSENMYALLTVPDTFYRRVNLGLSGVNILWIFDWSFVFHKWPKTEWISAVLLVECTVWRVFQRLTAKRQFMSKIETGHFLGFNNIFKVVLVWFSNLRMYQHGNIVNIIPQICLTLNANAACGNLIWFCFYICTFMNGCCRRDTPGMLEMKHCIC